MALRLVFMGTPDFAVPALTALSGSGHNIVAVYTRAPRPAKRGLDLIPTPIALEAERLKIPIFTPATLKTDDAAAAMRAHGADAAVVVAYGVILPKSILDIFSLGCFNLHASLLPRWRGAAPIHRAVMAGDKETGVKVMRMDEGLDTGAVAKGKRVKIDPNSTTGDLRNELARVGAALMLRAITALGKRRAWKFKPQSEKRATYARKIDKNEAQIDWKEPCAEVHNHCRGLSPDPGAWFEIPSIGRVRVLRTAIGVGDGSSPPPGHVIDNKPTIACGKGALRLVEVQRAGGKVMPADAFWRGVRVSVLI
ncbi:MAG: methionyl-tRNA formyltransferase [Xanthobacteraceae bacterium]